MNGLKTVLRVAAASCNSTFSEMACSSLDVATLRSRVLVNDECYPIGRPAKGRAAHGIWASEFGILWQAARTMLNRVATQEAAKF